MKTRLAAFLKLFTFALALLAALPAGAAERKVYATPDLADKRYYMCHRDDECAPANLPCGRVVVVNTMTHDDVQGWFDFIGHSYQCEQPVKQQKASNIACIKNTCTATIAVVPVVKPDSPEARNPAYCTADADCAVVIGRCKEKLFVNKKLQNSLQSDYDKMRRTHTEGCFWPDNRTVKNLRCEKNACTADLEIPDQNYWNDPVKIEEGQSDKELDKKERERERAQ